MIDNNCIFCKIANGDIKSNTIFEDEDFRAILDISPASKGHILILPKKHFQDISQTDINISAKLLPLASFLANACEKALNAKGFNILINKGQDAGQTVFHTHLHIIPRYENDKKILTWDSMELDNSLLSDICDKIKGYL